MRLQGRLEVSSWQEDEVRTLDGGRRLTRAAIGYRMSGDAEGEAVSDVVMFYRPDGTATVIGLWTLTATVGGRHGSLAFEATGGYDGTTAESHLRAVADSGTNELAGVTGTGTTTATRERVDYELDLDL